MIGTGASAGFAHPVRVRGMTAAVGVIGIEAVVRDSDVTVNINADRGRPDPGEIHRVLSLHFVARGNCR